jgi:hypothetical protein
MTVGAFIEFPAVILAALRRRRLAIDLLPVVLTDIGDEQVTGFLVEVFSGRDPILFAVKPCSVIPNSDINCGLSALAKGLSFGTAYGVSSSVSTSIRRSLPHKTFRFCPALSGSPSQPASPFPI